MSKNKPEHIIKKGAVRASIFRNIWLYKGQNIPLWKVALEVRYRDSRGRWRSANSLSLNEIPKAITALQEAFDYLLATANKRKDPSQPTGD